MPTFTKIYNEVVIGKINTTTPELAMENLLEQIGYPKNTLDHITIMFNKITQPNKGTKFIPDNSIMGAKKLEVQWYGS